MKNGWNRTTLGEIADVKGGKRVPKGYQLQTQATNHPYITVSDFTEDGTIDSSGLRYVSDEVFEQIKAYTITSRDLYLSIAGTIGKTGCIPPELDGANLTENACKLVLSPSINRDFLYYFTKSLSFLEQAGANTRTAAQPKLALERLKTIQLAIPSLPEQRRIVTILDEAFEGIATAKANAEKNLQNAHALFESQLELVFRKCGPGWTETTVGNLVSRNIIEPPIDGNHGEIHPKKADFVESGVPFLMASDLKDGVVDQENCNFISREQADSLRKGFAKDGDVLLSHKGTIGRVAILRTDHEYVVLTPQITYYRIVDSRTLLNRFLYYAFQDPRFITIINEIAGAGSTRAYIGITKQHELPVSFPLLNEQKRIATQLDSLFAETQRLESIYQRKVAALDELKKSLLHQAFTGELTKASAPVVIPFPVSVPGLSTTDLHAGLLAIAYESHEQANKQKHFGHVKAEKISHMLEALAGIDLGREPIKDAAGPNDFKHLQKVEFRADKAGFFTFTKRAQGGYTFTKGPQFDSIVSRTRKALGDLSQKVDKVIQLMLPMDTQEAEIFATVYAAWNNLLLNKQPITDERIVTEARENWHPEKLKIPREKFFDAIRWMQENEIRADGRGKIVKAK